MSELSRTIVDVVLRDLLDRHTVGDELDIIKHDCPEIWQEIVDSLVRAVDEVVSRCA